MCAHSCDYTYTQPFNGRLSGTTWASRYQKKHSPTHTHEEEEGFAQTSVTGDVSKNDTDVAHYNFDTHQLILVIFDRNVAESVCYPTVICFLTSPNQCLYSTWRNTETRKSGPSNAVLMVCQSRTTCCLISSISLTSKLQLIFVVPCDSMNLVM